MMADADLFNAYAYATATGKTASEIMQLPVNEVRGFIAFRRIAAELVSTDHG